MPKRKNITGSNSTTSGIALQTILPKIFNVVKMHNSSYIWTFKI